MATNRGLRSTDLELQSARQSFIQSIENKEEFNRECAIIIPVLQKQWTAKILTPFNLPYTEEIEVGTMVNNSPLLQNQEGVNHINWRHYLYNYSPFLLQKAITRLASRMELDANGTVKNARGPIVNVPAYFKALVQDLRVRELNPRKRRNSQKPVPGTLIEVEDTSRDDGATIMVECVECYDEYGSHACLRPAHLQAKAARGE